MIKNISSIKRQKKLQKKNKNKSEGDKSEGRGQKLRQDPISLVKPLQ